LAGYTPVLVTQPLRRCDQTCAGTLAKRKLTPWMNSQVPTPSKPIGNNSAPSSTKPCINCVNEIEMQFSFGTSRAGHYQKSVREWDSRRMRRASRLAAVSTVCEPSSPGVELSTAEQH